MEEPIGKIIHFYDKISVGVIRLDSSLKASDAIHVKGSVTDFEQAIESMQINHQNVEDGRRGDEVAVKLVHGAKEGDVVYKKS